jgi:VanZ family protein
MNKGSVASAASATLSAVGFLATVGLAAVLSVRAYRRELPAWLCAGHSDKVLHFALAGTLAFFLDGALRARPAWRGSFAPPLAAVLVLAPVGLEEYLQRYSAARTSSIWDFAADVGGVTLFIVVARKLVPLLGAAWRQRVATQPRS